MTDQQKNCLISQIQIQIQECESQIEELEQLTQPIPLDASIGRVTRMDAINNKTINESSLRDKKKLQQRLAKALERSVTKEFGLCMKCGNEIPYGRLEYLPHTTRCVQCAS